MDGFYEFFAYEAFDFLCKSDTDYERADKLIAKVRNYEAVGDFATGDYEGQKPIYAAYTLIALERLAQHALHEGDGWKCMQLLMEIYECISYFSPELIPAKFAARKANEARHVHNRATASRIVHWYFENHKKFQSLDAAAEAVTRIESVAFRTARKHIGEAAKELRSTRKE